MAQLVDGKLVRYELLPARFQGGVERYIERGGGVGHFLTAVICGDLFEACRRADPVSRVELFEICGWFYDYAPSLCYGSREKVKQWTAARKAEREAA
jgi:hypothetical protein